MTNDVRLQHIAALAAQVYAGKDYFRLTRHERELVDLLTQDGYLTAKTGSNFVGRASRVSH